MNLFGIIIIIAVTVWFLYEVYSIVIAIKKKKSIKKDKAAVEPKEIDPNKVDSSSDDKKSNQED